MEIDPLAPLSPGVLKLRREETKSMTEPETPVVRLERRVADMERTLWENWEKVALFADSITL